MQGSPRRCPPIGQGSQGDTATLPLIAIHGVILMDNSLFGILFEKDIGSPSMNVSTPKGLLAQKKMFELELARNSRTQV